MSENENMRVESAGPSDDDFQARLTGLLEWLADRDPLRAARLFGDYLDDLARERVATAPATT